MMDKVKKPARLATGSDQQLKDGKDYRPVKVTSGAPKTKDGATTLPKKSQKENAGSALMNLSKGLVQPSAGSKGKDLNSDLKTSSQTSQLTKQMLQTLPGPNKPAEMKPNASINNPSVINIPGPKIPTTISNPNTSLLSAFDPSTATRERLQVEVFALQQKVDRYLKAADMMNMQKERSKRLEQDMDRVREEKIALQDEVDDLREKVQEQEKELEEQQAKVEKKEEQLRKSKENEAKMN